MDEPKDLKIIKTMLILHSVITRGVHLSLETCKGYLAGAPIGGREGFVDYCTALTGLTDEHHVGEDEIIFPFLRPLSPDTPFDRLSADHQRIVLLLRSAEAHAAAWGQGDDAALGELAGTLAEFKEIWHPHIAIEEGDFTAEKLAGLMSSEDDARLDEESGQHAMQNIKLPHLVMPFLLYSLDPERRAAFAARFPEPLVKQVIPIDWKDKWAPMKPWLLP